MEREQVVARMETLREQAEAAHNMVQAISGAIQDCEYWLATMDEDAAAVAEDEYTNHERVTPPHMGELPEDYEYPAMSEEDHYEDH